MSQIKDLATHPSDYVTVAELAVYWGVSTRVIYYWISVKGSLRATRLSSGTLRIKTADAVVFGRPYEPTFGPVAAVR